MQQKLLKLDPGNSTLAAHQYRLLGDAIKETKEKLDALKKVEKQAKNKHISLEIFIPTYMFIFSCYKFKLLFSHLYQTPY